MKTFPLILLSLIISLSFVFAASPPQLPMIVSGNVSINDKPAKIGTDITAFMDDKQVSESKISEAGKFTLLLQKLENNQEISFFVDGIYANKTAVYKSGDFEQLNLKIEKSFLVYYMGVALILLVMGLLIWKRKK